MSRIEIDWDNVNLDEIDLHADSAKIQLINEIIWLMDDELLEQSDVIKYIKEIGFLEYIDEVVDYYTNLQDYFSEFRTDIEFYVMQLEDIVDLYTVCDECHVGDEDE